MQNVRKGGYLWYAISAQGKRFAETAPITVSITLKTAGATILLAIVGTVFFPGKRPASQERTDASISKRALLTGNNEGNGKIWRESSMKDDKIQTGLRIPVSRYNELSDLAAEIGISLNALLLTLVDLGLSVRNRQIFLQEKSE